jgi:Predicted extracellular nuclease
MYKTLTISILLIILSPQFVFAQEPFTVMSYNVENLFDTRKSGEWDDGEFQSDGARRWTNGRYYRKLQNIAKVISAAGEWDTPTIIGLCEVEGDSAVSDLLSRTPLRNMQYQFCTATTNDRRGITNALLYQRDKFRYISHHSHQIHFRKREKKSRNILHVCGQNTKLDTLDIFVCHFPSRYMGERESERDRIDAATHLRSLCDSLYDARNLCRIIIMGDFNDTPTNKSLSEILKAKRIKGNQTTGQEGLQLFNLFHNAKGSHKHQGKWQQIDHIIISEVLIKELQPQSVQTFSPKFILAKDNTFQGYRPMRTFHGFKHEGGFSDHLPLLASFTF